MRRLREERGMSQRRQVAESMAARGKEGWRPPRGEQNPDSSPSRAITCCGQRVTQPTAEAAQAEAQAQSRARRSLQLRAPADRPLVATCTADLRVAERAATR